MMNPMVPRSRPLNSQQYQHGHVVYWMGRDVRAHDNYALLEAQKSLEEFKFNDARRSLFRAIFYNSIAVLRLARTTNDTKLEQTAFELYEKTVIEPIGKASERVRKEFINSFERYLKEKGLTN